MKNYLISNHCNSHACKCDCFTFENEFVNTTENLAEKISFFFKNTLNPLTMDWDMDIPLT